MPPDAGFLIEQAQTALQQNRLLDARKAATEALRLNPKLGDAEIILGLVATAGKDLVGAEAHFTRAVALQPGNPRAHGYLGSTYLAAKRPDEAAVRFREVLRLDPSNTAAHFNLGVLATMQQKPEIAVRHFEAIIRTNPADIAALGALMQAQLALKRTSAAQSTADNIRRALPASDPRVLEAGALLASSGDYFGALPIFESVHKAIPDSADAAYNLALALFRTNQPERAAGVLEPFSRSAETLNLLGKIQESRGYRRAALQALKRAAELEPANEDYRVDHAAFLVDDADPKLAVAAFSAAARDFPRSARVHVGLGSAYYLAEQYEQAASALLNAFELDPALPVLYRLLGRVHETAGNHQERIQRAVGQYIGRQMLISANHAETVNALQVKQYLEKALALNPRLADAHLQLGILAQRNGDFQGAIESFRRAVEYAPESAPAHYRLAIAFAKAGQIDRSKAEMELFQTLRANERDRDKELVRSLASASLR
jgi:tetratricopeptide (TPR) repeat protein